MSRFAGHGNSSLPIYVVTHRGIGFSIQKKVLSERHRYCKVKAVFLEIPAAA
jgi:hypothetical protein